MNPRVNCRLNPAFMAFLLSSPGKAGMEGENWNVRGKFFEG
jgi:hypothetical protein